MADLRISEASQETLRARLASPEGKQALLRLAQIIADMAVDAMPPAEREALKTPEGMKAFLAAWPDLVEAFLLHAARPRDPKAGVSKTRKKTGRGRSAAKS